MEKKNHQEGKKFTQKQEWFRKQSPEHRWSIIKPFLDLFTSAVSGKMRILPSLSAISVAMLIVATLKPDLMGLGIIPTKLILSILLFLIPSSLIVHVLEQEKAARKALEYAEEYQKDVFNLYKRERMWWDKLKEKIADSKIWDRFASEFPICVALIYLIIVIYLLYSIWI